MENKLIDISIITINLNNKVGLESTIKSVICQTHKNFEFIIIDGSSTDGSKEVIETYSNKITAWVSETDKGIYHAMNKGIKMAKGEFCLFLNSADELYASNTLERIFKETLTGDIINFDTLVVGENKSQLVRSNKDISFYDFYKHSILHQGTLIKRNLFEKYGLYNENHKVVSDWEFFLKTLFIHHGSYQSFEIPISKYDSNGLSSQQKYHDISFKERQNIFQELFPLFLKDYALLERKSTYEYLSLVNKNKFLKFVFSVQTKLFRLIFKKK